MRVGEREKDGERERWSVNAGLGWLPSLLMTQRHVLRLEVGGIRVHNRFWSTDAAPIQTVARLSALKVSGEIMVSFFLRVGKH